VAGDGRRYPSARGGRCRRLVGDDQGGASISPAGNDPAIVIIGAGFAGLCMAIWLKQAGYHDFLILEKNDDLGGT
jgi:NADPH-dependent 2,4-dienoyl-CoA reductase/sulfur reductase-like enzyme